MEKSGSEYGVEGMNAPASTVDEYIAAAPAEYREALVKLRKAIKTAAPKSEELISYRIPTFKYNGPLVCFAAFKDHLSFFVVSKSILKTFKNELKGYKTSETTIHFTPDNPIPADLVKKIVKERILENQSRTDSKYNKGTK